MSQKQQKKSSGLGPDLAKLAIGIGSNVANLFYPGAGMAGAALNFAIDRYVKRPQALLVEEMEAKKITELSEIQMREFVPMAYRYFESAKEGEYEHNLRVLASYIANELKREIPDAPAVSRMARRLEGLTQTELRVIALINSSLSSGASKTLQSRVKAARPFVSAHGLAKHPDNKCGFDGEELAEALTELASRGFLIPDGAARLSKSEEYYFASRAFRELIERAEETIETMNAEPARSLDGGA